MSDLDYWAAAEGYIAEPVPMSERDIVEQLRWRASYLREGSLYSRAADEIERLRLIRESQPEPEPARSFPTPFGWFLTGLSIIARRR
jgi:hypothetical protein